MTETQNYTTRVVIDATPKEVFTAISNPRGWWSESIEGDTDRLGAEFQYQAYEVHRATFRITEFAPEQKVVWHVVSNYFSFVQDKTEWTGTDIVFEIVPHGEQTEVRFTHVGLVVDYECYDVCATSWDGYVTRSLHDFITSGKGQPNPVEEIVAQVRQKTQ